MTVDGIWLCPLTGKDLRFVDDSTLVGLNARIAQGELHHVGGMAVEGPIEAALVTDDYSTMYPVVGGVMLLLASMSIPLAEADDLPSPSEVAVSKENVRAFYDEIGWVKSKDGVYVDTQLFSDSSDVGNEYSSTVHRRVRRHFDDSGTYLLDIASGPVQFPEYVAYSEAYDIRICADISIRALHEARERLGDRGLYVLCDITRIPIRDESVDAFVSLHTIYHVEASEQLTAFSELVRVLKPGHRGVVVYMWPFPSALMSPFHPIGVLKRLVKWALPATLVGAALHRFREQTTEGGLYFHPYGHSWYRRNLADSFGAECLPWRSTTLVFQRRFAHRSLGGQRLLRVIAHLEDRFPTLFGRFGQYPMFVFRK